MNFTEYFYQNWLDKLVTIIGVLIGTVTGVAILVSKISECIKAFKICSDDVKERGNELREIKQSSNELNETLKDSLESLKSSSEASKKLNENYEEMREKFFKESEDIKKVLLLAFSSDPDLVKKGYAEEIVKIIKGEKNEHIDETKI